MTDEEDEEGRPRRRSRGSKSKDIVVVETRADVTINGRVRLAGCRIIAERGRAALGPRQPAASLLQHWTVVPECGLREGDVAGPVWRAR